MRFSVPTCHSALLAVFISVGGTACARAAAGAPPADGAAAYETADETERATIDQLLSDPAWTKRAIGLLRLERYRGDERDALLRKGLVDEAWQVRSFAYSIAGRTDCTVDESVLAAEQEPRVIRTAMRSGFTFDPERIGRGARFLMRSDSLDDKLLGAELAAASNDETLHEEAKEAIRTVILRMDRAQAGVLSPRLAVLTGRHDLRRHYRWRNWLMKEGRLYTLQSGRSEDVDAPSPTAIAEMTAPRFVEMARYLNDLSQRDVDLAICIDCTSSMWGELAAAQEGMSDLMLFVGDVVRSLRVGLIAYRDRRNEFETRGWDFTENVAETTTRLWQLAADEGGDTPEAVHAAMELVLSELSWRHDSDKTLILIGDGPPHVGFGLQCVEMARQAAETAQLQTHVIQADGEDVQHFPEIAEAGGGRCVSLEDDAELMPEVAGMTIGGRFNREMQTFYNLYLELCR